MHSATHYTGVKGNYNALNKYLEHWKELEYDEGLAGQIYRASEPNEIFTSGKEYSKQDIENTLKHAASNLRYFAFRNAGYNPSEGKAVQISSKLDIGEDNIPVGENAQREEVDNLLISELTLFYKSKSNTRALCKNSTNCWYEAYEPFRICWRTMDTPMPAELKYWRRPMTSAWNTTKIRRWLWCLYKFMNEMLSYGGPSLFF